MLLELGTGNPEPGTRVWERVYSGNLRKSFKLANDQHAIPYELKIIVNSKFCSELTIIVS